ncbi:uncharacterized protein LOC142337043 [Convolutriloba macropyga]|uniref:uncharacterized protein LOC142337043 n=1 Tax=Convolutriloba macropyga TaxID=536237 RepID=UPI003F52804B
MLALLTAVTFLTSYSCGNIVVNQHPISFSNVVSFQLIHKVDSEPYMGVLTLDNDYVGTIRLSLAPLQTYTYNAGHVTLSPSQCLYEGHVVHTVNGNDEIDMDSPARLRYCHNELQGFLVLNGKTYDIDYDQDQRVSYLYAKESLLHDQNGEHGKCGVEEESAKRSDWTLPRESDEKRGLKRQSDEKPELYFKMQVTVNHEFGHYKGIDRNRSNSEVLQHNSFIHIVT